MIWIMPDYYSGIGAILRALAYAETWRIRGALCAIVADNLVAWVELGGEVVERYFPGFASAGRPDAGKFR